MVETTFKISFYPTETGREKLIGSLKESNKELEKIVMGFNVKTVLKVNDNITLSITYPITISERIFKHMAFNRLKKKVKRIDKKCKVEYIKIKTVPENDD